jgi:hypothetical protein
MEVIILIALLVLIALVLHHLRRELTEQRSLLLTIRWDKNNEIVVINEVDFSLWETEKLSRLVTTVNNWALYMVQVRRNEEDARSVGRVTIARDSKRNPSDS